MLVPLHDIPVLSGPLAGAGASSSDDLADALLRDAAHGAPWQALDKLWYTYVPVSRIV